MLDSTARFNSRSDSEGSNPAPAAYTRPAAKNERIDLFRRSSVPSNPYSWRKRGSALGSLSVRLRFAAVPPLPRRCSCGPRLIRLRRSAYRARGGPNVLISSTSPAPFSVSRAQKPSTGVLSTSGIRNHDAVEGVDAPAAQEVHDVRPLLRSSRIDEITLATGLH